MTSKNDFARHPAVLVPPRCSVFRVTSGENGPRRESAGERSWPSPSSWRADRMEGDLLMTTTELEQPTAAFRRVRWHGRRIGWARRTRLGAGRLTVVLSVLSALLGAGVLVAPAAFAAPEIQDAGPAGTAVITLRPYGNDPNTLALTYNLVNSQGATATEITLTPVGLNADSKTRSFAGNSAYGMELYKYTPGAQVSVGIHIVFLTPSGVQNNSRHPYVVTYPK